MKILISALFILAAGSATACPMAGKTYIMRAQGNSARITFNADCTQAVEVYNRKKFRHLISSRGKDWVSEIPRNNIEIVFSRTGKSGRILLPDGVIPFSLIPAPD